jgi:endonuclease/exonuclease/phosphatase family metal-dependent hydrolase
VKLLSYNILDGGVERADAIARVIEAQRPDVVGLVEADDAGIVESLASRLGTDFIHAPGRTHASALLSRFAIAETVNHALVRDGLSKSLLQAAVVVPGFGELPIGVVHLHARAFEEDETIRERELAVVLDVFAADRSANRPHLLCGDFNANAPYQRIDPQKCKPKTRAAWEQQSGLPRRVVQQLLDAGYVDTLYVVDRDAGESAGTFTTEDPGQRVDYIFAYGIERARIRMAWVVNEPPAKDASDHYPVAVDLL